MWHFCPSSNYRSSRWEIFFTPSLPAICRGELVFIAMHEVCGEKPWWCWGLLLVSGWTCTGLLRPDPGSRKAAVHWAHANLLLPAWEPGTTKPSLDNKTQTLENTRKSQVIKASCWRHPDQREKPSRLYFVLLSDSLQSLCVSWESPVQHQNFFRYFSRAFCFIIPRTSLPVVSTGRQEKLCKDLSLQFTVTIPGTPKPVEHDQQPGQAIVQEWTSSSC